MKILIQDARILTFRVDKPVIERGYIYLNKGRIEAIGEGPPPPEYEFAEYIIDGRGRVVMPGFVLGIGSIEGLSLAYVSKCSSNARECLSSLSKDEIKALIETTLTLLSFKGATSIVATVLDADNVDVIAKAVSEAWIRTRLLFPEVQSLKEGVKVASRSVVDQEALPRGIISFGLIGKSGTEITLDELRSLDAYAYINACRSDDVKRLSDRIVCINSSIDIGRNIVIDSIEMWRGSEAIGFTDPKMMNPQKFLSILSSQGFNPKDVVKILANLNPRGFAIGISELVEGNPADLIILNFREPPYGPRIFDVEGLYELICDGLYGVETVLVSGELVVDRFEPLMVGKKTFDIVLRLREELS